MGTDPVLLTDNLTFPESPRWKEDRLWFSDIDEGRVKTVGLDGTCHTILEFPNPISGLGFSPDNELLIASVFDRKLLCWDGSEIRELANLESMAAFGINDMIVSSEGNAYIGTLMYDFLRGEKPKDGPLILVRPDGQVSIAAEGLSFPNGMVITPDGRTLICGETQGQRYTAFDIAADGSLSNRRLWADLPGESPDGCCMDAEGAIWCSSADHHRVIRVFEGGKIDRRIELPSTNSYACMLGGPNGTTLFLICCETADRSTKLSGKIFTVEVDVPHAGLP